MSEFPSDVSARLVFKRNDFDEEVADLFDSAANCPGPSSIVHDTTLDGDCLCHSVVHDLGGGLWRLAWIETKEAMLGESIAGWHLSQLMQWIKSEEERARVLTVEVNSRKAGGQPGYFRDRMRERIAAFYSSLGAQIWEGEVFRPCDAVENGYCDLERMQVMCFVLRGKPLGVRAARDSIRGLLLRGFSIDPKHELVKLTLNQKFPRGVPRRINSCYFKQEGNHKLIYA